MNFFKNLILGNFSLAKTFWIYFIFGSLSASSLANYFQESHPELPFLIQLLPTSIAAFVKISAMVAVWNSSGKYDGKIIWVYLVRLIVGYEMIMTAINLVK